MMQTTPQRQRQATGRLRIKPREFHGASGAEILPPAPPGGPLACGTSPLAHVKCQLIGNGTGEQRAVVREALKWVRRIACGIACITVFVVILGPWALYWWALSYIDGRPPHASYSAFTAEDAEVLWRKLREPLPIHVEPLSPHVYLWVFFRGDARAFPRGTQLAWWVAKAYNHKHLENRLWWHPSGAAMTIWLTRNWTADELIAKGIELDKRSKPAARCGGSYSDCQIAVDPK
jgi:hypothetical protein